MQFLDNMQFLSGSQFSQIGLGFGELGDLALSSFNNCATNEHYCRRMWYALQFDTVMAADNSSSASNNNNNNNLINNIIMDTSSSPSPDAMDSRKRNAENSLENGQTKRLNHGGDGMCQIKILVPSYAAGAIIGKGGETIAQIQKDTNTKIKMSKANDFYPGTSDRVCLISGLPDAIMTILKFIMQKMRERPEGGSKDFKIDQEREKQMKVLIPNSTAGMIIGKGGNYVKLLQEQSSAYVQLSQKAKELQERCITVSGSLEANEKALQMILEKIVEDPLSGSCSNISYADVNGPVASVNPTGSPYASTSFISQSSSLNSVGHGSLNANFGGGNQGGLSNNSMLGNAGSGGLNFSLNFNPPALNRSMTTATLQLIEHMKILIRSLGYSDLASNEISEAMATLAKYGILGLGLGTQPALDNYGGSSWQDGYGSNRGDYMRPNSPGQYNASYTGSEGESKKVDVEVPEVIVGAILGPGGRSLNDIINRSGANVQISKKGSFAPGTRNRVVTITGNPNAIAYAQVLIDRKISDEESKRVRLGLSSSASMSMD